MRYRKVYEHRGPNPIRHLAREADATICEEYIDTDYADAPVGEPEPCAVCDSLIYHDVYDAARRQVAQELGVDESEVF